MSETDKLKNISKEVADFYNRVHQVITFPDNSVQSYRATDIAETYEDIIRDSSVSDGMKVLDSGCGLGAFAAYLVQKKSCDVTAITFSETEFTTAQKTYGDKSTKGNLHYQQADFHFMKNIFSNETFDMVMFLESFEHVYDKEKVLRDAFDILKPGGFLFIKYHFVLWKNAAGREEAFKKTLQSETDSMRIFTHLALHEYIKLCESIGFQLKLIKLPSINTDDYRSSNANIEVANSAIKNFNFTMPDFPVTQCYNTLLQKL